MSLHDRNPRGAKLGALGFAAVALACAAIAAFVAGRLLQAGGYTGERVRPVVVAARPLPAAQPLTKTDLKVASWPEAWVPSGAVSRIEDLFVGDKPPVPTAGILEGEPVLPARLATASQGTAMAALVEPGKRAVAVKVDEAVKRAGLVYPGANVDVMATIRDPEGRGPSTKIAVENVRVLSVELETDVATRRPKREDGPTSDGVQGTVVTLQVNPREAEIVSLAAREGSVDLALRNGSDHSPAGTRGATPFAFTAYSPSDAAIASLAVPRPAPALSSGALVATTANDKVDTESKRSSRRKIELRVPDADMPARVSTQATTMEIETYHAR
ncbi:MAG: Flp pilus assembly protein CpaB [Deltaproteobacteria bacterium]|nr:Flp pilus assembly protein CpaB [Deltaproteobacteria bacterium]